ncbi:restriction endonuclease subunit S [Arundinibacter roseus]|uniref:Type I restriction modification DNA specificity domain-containing protein n=1 Tax=Arundinibacter roseus TaxID=2070510 RepID=A0A4R4KFY3_9BACT|nr:restriction endonuclease subunit S [Arundinibacter roseus]TDB66934.1 hypothetical protein EZE20_07375 [Arundinibacter roseus]
MSWQKFTLGELCLIEKGKIGISKAIPGEYPLVVTAEERLTHNEFHFEGNAVVIPLVSSTGHGHRSLKRIHYQTGQFAVGSILCVVQPKDESVLRADYLYRFLDLNKEEELVGRMKGMANVSLPMKEIAKIEIPLPPIEEQIKFVEKYLILETQNANLSTELTHQLHLVKQLRQAFLREAMQGKLVAQDPTDEPASELLARIKAEKGRLVKEKKIKKEKPLPPISEEEVPFDYWKKIVFIRLGEVCIVEKGKVGIKKAIDGVIPLVVTGEERLTHNESHFSGKGILIPLVSSTGHGHASLKRIHFEDGDFAVGNILACVMTYLPQFFNMKFMYHYLDYYKHFFFVDKMKGAANVSLKVSSILETPLPVISLAEQDLYENLVKYTDALEASIRGSQQHNEQLLQQVLREALAPEGQVVE